MTVLARTIGGPGSGKTTRNLEIMEMVLDRLVRDPLRVGFVSFTRAARHEAAVRAAEKFGLTVTELERHGWFRTLHSVAYRQLGIGAGELITGSKDDSEWLKVAVEDPHVSFLGIQQDDDYLGRQGDISAAGQALALWELARNRQTTLRSVQEPAYEVDDRIPSLDTCERVAGLYEAAKAKDGRLDFGDLLLRFAGRRWTGDHTHPWEDCVPAGDNPNLPVWIHDEAQDMSRLTERVFRRLIQTAQWVYLAGDHAQSIYGWAGSDGRIFADWPVAKEEELPRSHRCGQAILDCACRVLGHDPRYASRKNYQGHSGGVVRGSESLEATLSQLQPGEDAMILFRTNEDARICGQQLDHRGFPWKPIKGNGTFAAPARVEGVTALAKLRRGEAIDPQGFWRILQLLPTKQGGTEFFSRGTKTWFAEADNRAAPWDITLKDLVLAGATPAGQELIASGRYLEVFDDKAARQVALACEKYGEAAAQNPTCRIGTIHASKGLEADKVVLLNKLPWPTHKRIQNDDAETTAEERRVWYTGLTRARHEVTLVTGYGNEFFGV